MQHMNHLVQFHLENEMNVGMRSRLSEKRTFH